MHLFGDSSGPHLTHFQARREGNRVELGWEISVTHRRYAGVSFARNRTSLRRPTRFQAVVRPW